MDYTCLVSSHGNAHLSGVAKFNFILAKALSIPRICIQDYKKIESGPVLFSFKLSDQSDFDREKTNELISFCGDRKIIFDIFFHTFNGSDIELFLIERCRKIYCGNSEIFHTLDENNKRKILAWCPALVDTEKAVSVSNFNVFSFGMAHKINVKNYHKLHRLLEDNNLDYSLLVSTAFHEKANFGDFNVISDDLSQIFGDKIHFLGFLSDGAINYFMDRSDLFVAFFDNGVRANNTSIHAALDRGCATLTNCDRYSPEWMIHGKNILDIDMIKPEQLNQDFLEKIRRNAPVDSRTNAGWSNLIDLFNREN